ncbi:MAG: lectin-like protein, partial [Pseudomonadota bacterium]
MLAASITPEVEPNDSRFFATALSPLESPPSSGYHAAFGSGFLTAGESDYFTFTALAGDHISINVEGIGDRLDSEVVLRNSAGGELRRDRDSGPGADSLTPLYTAPSSGRFYVEVLGDTLITSGDYKFRVDIGRGINLETDANYVNDSTGGADGLSFEQTGALRTASIAGTVMGAESSNTDQDVFALGFMRADSLISLSLDRPEWSTLNSPELEILNSSGSVVASADDLDPFALTFTAQVDDSYYARVRTATAILDGSRFTLTSQRNDWSVVRAEAQAAGGDLVSIGSLEENQLIFDTFGGSRWIGFTDESSEGTYQWSDGSPVTYTRWAVGEPNTPSYDHAYMASNGFWYDERSWIDFHGIFETAAESGDPLISGAGIEAQYLLDASVELRDLVPPVVTAVGRLPAESETTNRVLSTFSVTLSELDPATLSDEAFDLRASGADGLFDTA